MPTVRQIADNEWLLLLSRAAAGVGIPFAIGAFAFAWNMNAQQAVIQSNVARHETLIVRNTERISQREANAFTAADAAAMEARFERDFALILEEIRALRAEQAEDRRRNP